MTIDKRDPPEKTTRSKWGKRFDEMEPGDSFYFEGRPSIVGLAFGYWLSRGRYSIQKEGKGHRFYWLKSKKEK